MQVTSGRVHAVFPMGDPSRVGEARRHAAQLASRAGLDDTAAGRLAIVVTELGNNLVRHAQHGQLLLAANDGEVETIAVDRGPGMDNVQRHMNDGFSTGGTPGTGLGAVKRLSQDFDVHSRTGEGTVIVSRVRGNDAKAPPVAVRVGGVATSAPGETVCGDGWAACHSESGATLVMADGLGHGKPAADAAQAMIDLFKEQAGASSRELLEEGHRRLRTTRGAAVALIKLDGKAKSVSCAGAGNVMGRMISGISDRTLVTQHGTVGLQMRQSQQETTYEWPPHAVVAVHTDGIESRWTPQRVVAALSRDPVIVAAIIWRDHCRGRDDATVVVAMRSEAAA